jgi:hypothetical protein
MNPCDNLSIYGGGKSGFPHAKEFLQKLFSIWARTLKNVRQPTSRVEKFKEYRLEGTPNF